uniref:AAA family ATPase n=1 Tax=Puniceibacterium confluentis TaxID=1958944 RepID=UPI003566630B
VLQRMDAPKAAAEPEGAVSDAARAKAFRAAAVQHVFCIPELAAEATAEGRAVAAALHSNSFAAPGHKRAGRRTLNRAERLRQLEILATPEAARAVLAGLPQRVMTQTQTLFESLLQGATPSPERLTQTQLIRLGEVQRWAQALGIMPVPSDRMELALGLAAVVSSFQHLISEHFVGREADVSAMLEFLGLEDQSLLARATSFFRGEKPRIMFIEGVGGIGKTALIGHVLNTYRADSRGPRFAFAYMPCDDPTFDILRSEIMLAEAAEQVLHHVRLSATYLGQVPLDRFEARYRDFQDQLQRSESLTRTFSTRSSKFDSQGHRLENTRDVREVLWAEFALLADSASEALRRSGTDQPAVVLIIDTFEDVQGRIDTTSRHFWTCLSMLMQFSSNIRIVVAGRSPLARPDLGVPSHFISMQELHETAALDLLARETGGRREDLHGVVRKIGGNPLNLRLAARVLGENGAGALGDIRTRSRLFQRLGPEIIRGRLYQRVLDHIQDDDPRVRKLAHPGMILRRITPDIIQTVLARICDIAIADDADAQQLFDALQREHTLVRLEDDGSLRYRQDLRQSVLDLLRADQPEITLRAHQHAARYYSAPQTPIELAEYIYHTLMLGEEPDAAIYLSQKLGTLDPAVHPYLVNAMDELPPRGRLFLASHLGLVVPDDLRAAADTEEWEQIVGPRLLRVLASAETAAALEMLGEREGRTEDSPLIAIEARCYLSLEDYQTAQEFLRAKLDSFPVIGNPGRRAELTWLLAQAQLRSGNREGGIQTLLTLEEAARTLLNPVAWIQTLALLVDLVKPGDSRRDGLQDTLASALLSCSDDLLDKEADVIRHAFSRIHPDQSPKLPRVATTAISTLFDIVAQHSRFAMTRPIFDGLRATFAPYASAMEPASEDDRQERSDAAILAASVLKVLDQPQQTTSGFLSLLSLIRAAIVRSESRADLVMRVACRGTWWLTQAVEGSLMAATLGGLEPYRAPWELSADQEVLA